MDDWEIDDQTMMEIYDDYERNKVADDEVEFVPETQVEDLPTVGATETNEETNEEVESELVCATRENVVLENPQPVQQSMHTRLMTVLAHQKPNTSSSTISGRSVLCYCGVECNIVVSKSQRNAGRRFYGCKAYIDAQTRQGVNSCKFFEWFDPPMTKRGVQYALEMQATVSRLERMNIAIRNEMLAGCYRLPRD